MKIVLPCLLALLLVLPGCTVNHYHYYGSTAGPATESNASQIVEERLALIEELQGVHTAFAVTLENIHCPIPDGYAKRARFLHGQSQPVIWEEPVRVIPAGQPGQGSVDLERDLNEAKILNEWQNELIEALNLSAGQRYKLSHLPLNPAFFDQLKADARQIAD